MSILLYRGDQEMLSKKQRLERKFRRLGKHGSLMYDTLMKLQQLYPYSKYRDLTFGFAPKREGHDLYPYIVPCNIEPGIYLLKRKTQWIEYYNSKSPTNLFAKIAQKFKVDYSEMTLNFYLVLTVIHEWCHLLQIKNEHNMQTGGPLYHVIGRGINRAREKEAEEKAWQILSTHGLEFLPKEDIPKALRQQSGR